MLGLLAQTTDYYTTSYNVDTAVNEGALAGMMAFLGIYMLFVLAAVVFMVVCLWKIFEKAGRPGWYAIVPILNAWTMAEIAGKPGWWSLAFLLAFIPVVGPIAALIVSIIINLELAKAFGKDTGFAVLLILLPIVGYPMLAFGDAKYGGAKPAAPKAA